MDQEVSAEAGSGAEDRTWEVVAGGVAGLALGLVTADAVRTLGAAAGGCVLLLQVAQARGYASLDWQRVQQDARTASGRLANPAGRRQAARLAEVLQSLRAHVTSALLGGFLLGFGMR